MALAAFVLFFGVAVDAVAVAAVVVVVVVVDDVVSVSVSVSVVVSGIAFVLVVGFANVVVAAVSRFCRSLLLFVVWCGHGCGCGCCCCWRCCCRRCCSSRRCRRPCSFCCCSSSCLVVLVLVAVVAVVVAFCSFLLLIVSGWVVAGCGVVVGFGPGPALSVAVIVVAVVVAGAGIVVVVGVDEDGDDVDDDDDDYDDGNTDVVGALLELADSDLVAACLPACLPACVCRLGPCSLSPALSPELSLCLCADLVTACFPRAWWLRRSSGACVLCSMTLTCAPWVRSLQT